MKQSPSGPGDQPGPRIRLYRPDESPEPKRRKRKRLPEFLRWPDAMRLLDWCIAEIALRKGRRRQAAAIRDEIIIRVGLYLGLRCSEIQNLDVTDIDLERRSALVREGKGQRDRVVRIPEKLVGHLASLIGTRREGILIVGRGGKRVSGRTIRWRIARAAKFCGLVLHVHPHTLRHTYATRYLETGGNIRRLQALLGHADLSTTAIYLDLDVSGFAADVDRL